MDKYTQSQHDLGKRLISLYKRNRKDGKYHGGPGILKRHIHVTELLSKYMDKNKPFIEIGSCEGYLFDHLKDAGFKDIYGIDISPDAIDKLKGRGYKGDVMDIHNSEMEDMFGSMVSSHSLEHCHDPKLAVENMRKALKVGGRLLVLVPKQSKSLPVPDQYGHWYHFESFEELLSFFPEDKWKLIWDDRPNTEIIVEKIKK